jgi:hypothetical protein
VKALFSLLVLITLAAAAEVKSFKLATGELLVHAFEGGVPLPAESKWTVCQGAGPSFVPEGKQHRINWNVVLNAKGSPAQLRDLVRVTVEEVSGASPVSIYDGPPQASEKGLLIIAPAQIVSRENYAWLYTPESTLFILRVILFKAKEQDKLLQPVLIGAGIKRQLKEGGYLP